MDDAAVADWPEAGTSGLTLVDTPVGPARLAVSRAARPGPVLLLGHGAGGGIEAPDLVAVDAVVAAAGYTVVRVEQPWRVAGRRVAPAPAVLDRAWLAVVEQVRTWTARRGGAGEDAVPLVFGGRSAGARVACRTAKECGAVAVVALAFPLHPPGRPERSRADELLGVGVPVLVVQGQRDAFGGPAEFEPVIGGRDVTLSPVEGRDHSLAPRIRRGATSTDDVDPDGIGRIVLRWLQARVG